MAREQKRKVDLREEREERVKDERGAKISLKNSNN